MDTFSLHNGILSCPLVVKKRTKTRNLPHGEPDPRGIPTGKFVGMGNRIRGWGWEGFRTSVLSTPLNILLFLSPSNFITKYTPLQTKKALFLFEEWMEEEFPNFKRMQGKHQTPASNSSKQISQTDTPREGDPGSLPPFDKEGNIKVPLMKTTFSKPYPLYSHNQAKLAR